MDSVLEIRAVEILEVPGSIMEILCQKKIEIKIEISFCCFDCCCFVFVNVFGLMG